ncbi:MAG: hypothetical protein J6Y03_00060 [Alphaproteobacteria bacterium]|nr:hypothetical protein [Alphaproteobacteria bacterium]
MLNPLNFFKKQKKTTVKFAIQKGRSMLEMLGVLAIVGILSIAGISLYHISINHHHANQIADDVERLALTIYERLEDIPKGEIEEGAVIAETDFRGNSIYALAAVKDSGESFYIDVPTVLPDDCSVLLPKAQDKHKMAIITKGEVRDFKKDETKPKDICQPKIIEDEPIEERETTVTVRFYFSGNPSCAEGCTAAELCNGCCCEGLSEGRALCLNDLRNELGDGVDRPERCCPLGTVSCGGKCVPDDCEEEGGINPETCACFGEDSVEFACDPVKIAHCVDYNYAEQSDECPCKECEEGFELDEPTGLCIKIRICINPYPGSKKCPRDEECVEYNDEFEGTSECCACTGWFCHSGNQDWPPCQCKEWNEATPATEKGGGCPCTKLMCYVPDDADTCADYATEAFSTDQECLVCESTCKEGYRKKSDGHCYTICNVEGVNPNNRVNPETNETGSLSGAVCAPEFICPCRGNREERTNPNDNGRSGCYCKFKKIDDCVKYEDGDGTSSYATHEGDCKCIEYKCKVPTGNPCCLGYDETRTYSTPNQPCPCTDVNDNSLDLRDTGLVIDGVNYGGWSISGNQCVRSCVPGIPNSSCTGTGVGNNCHSYNENEKWVHSEHPSSVVSCTCKDYCCTPGNTDPLCNGSENTSTVYAASQVTNGVVPFCPCNCNCVMPTDTEDAARRLIRALDANYHQVCASTYNETTKCYCDTSNYEERTCGNDSTKKCYCQTRTSANAIEGCSAYDSCSTNAGPCPCCADCCYCVTPDGYDPHEDPHRITGTLLSGGLLSNGTCPTTWSKGVSCLCPAEYPDRVGPAPESVHRCYCRERDEAHKIEGCVAYNNYSLTNADDDYCPCIEYSYPCKKPTIDSSDYNPCCTEYNEGQEYDTPNQSCPCMTGKDLSVSGLTIDGVKYTGWSKSSDNKTCERICVEDETDCTAEGRIRLPKWIYQSYSKVVVYCKCEGCSCIKPTNEAHRKEVPVDPVDDVCRTTFTGNATTDEKLRCPCGDGWKDFYEDGEWVCKTPCVQHTLPHELSDGNICTEEDTSKYYPEANIDCPCTKYKCVMPTDPLEASLRDKDAEYPDPDTKCPCPERCPDVNGICTCPSPPPCPNPPCANGVCLDHLCNSTDCISNCEESCKISGYCLMPHCTAISGSNHACAACETGYHLVENDGCNRCVPDLETGVPWGCSNWGVCDVTNIGPGSTFCTYSRSAVCRADSSGDGPGAYTIRKSTTGDTEVPNIGACNPVAFWGKQSVLLNDSAFDRFVYNTFGSVSAATAKSYCWAIGQMERNDAEHGYNLATDDELVSLVKTGKITGGSFWINGGSHVSHSTSNGCSRGTCAGTQTECNCIHAVVVGGKDANGNVSLTYYSEDDLKGIGAPRPENIRALCKAELLCRSWTKKGVENGGCPEGGFCYFGDATSCAESGIGKCLPVSDYAPDNSEVTTADGHKWLRSKPMNWWSAQSWCVSQSTVSRPTPSATTNSIACYPDTACTSTGYANLRSAASTGSNLKFWLQDYGNNCVAHVADSYETNNVAGLDRNEGNGHYALCDLGCPEGKTLNDEGVCKGEPIVTMKCYPHPAGSRRDPEYGEDDAVGDFTGCPDGYFCLFDNPFPAPTQDRQCTELKANIDIIIEKLHALGYEEYVSNPLNGVELNAHSCSQAYWTWGAGEGRCVPYADYPMDRAVLSGDSGRVYLVPGEEFDDTKRLNQWSAHSWCEYYGAQHNIDTSMVHFYFHNLKALTSQFREAYPLRMEYWTQNDEHTCETTTLVYMPYKMVYFNVNRGYSGLTGCFAIECGDCSDWGYSTQYFAYDYPTEEKYPLCLLGFWGQGESSVRMCGRTDTTGDCLYCDSDDGTYYGLTSDHQQCVECKSSDLVESCDTYSYDSTQSRCICSKCNETYKLVENQCVKCPTNITNDCAVYGDPGLTCDCISWDGCAKGYCRHVSANNEAEYCFDTHTDHCLDCVDSISLVDETKQCGKCDPGYYRTIDSDGNYSCEACDNAQGRELYFCDGRFLNPGIDCTCAACDEGYQLVNNRCTACNIKCSDYINPGFDCSCARCSKGYYPPLNANGVADIYNCEPCASDYYNTHHCDLFANSGLSCECLRCDKGYELVNGKCVSCPSYGCETYLRPGLSCVCAFPCASGYYQDANGVCQKCSENCSQCTNASVCTKCSWGYGLTAEHTCVECPEGCDPEGDGYYTEPGISCECSLCRRWGEDDTYGLITDPDLQNTGTCQLCNNDDLVDYCDFYEYNTTLNKCVCKSCSDEYHYAIDTTTNTCKFCSPYETTCAEYETDVDGVCECKKCDPGNTLLNGHCCDNNGWYYYSENGEWYEQSCCGPNEEWSTVKNKCICKDGFGLSAGVCTPCSNADEMERCAEAVNNNGTCSCTRCSTGYFVQNGKCVDCDETFINGKEACDHYLNPGVTCECSECDAYQGARLGINLSDHSCRLCPKEDVGYTVTRATYSNGHCTPTRCLNDSDYLYEGHCCSSSGIYVDADRNNSDCCPAGSNTKWLWGNGTGKCVPITCTTAQDEFGNCL